MQLKKNNATTRFPVQGRQILVKICKFNSAKATTRAQIICFCDQNNKVKFLCDQKNVIR